MAASSLKETEIAPSESEASLLNRAVATLQATAATRKTHDLAWRREQLQGIQKLLNDNKEAIANAAHDDLHRSAFETHLSEVRTVEIEVSQALANLATWTADVPASASYRQMPSSAFVRPEPLGTVLIIGAWNYPIVVTLGVLVSALAAGNCAVVKASEIAPATAAVLAELVPKYLDPEAVALVTGGPDASQSLLKHRFDHIFFTGSERVGRLVYAAAAEHLTPVTLELGGKSPTIVDATANLKVAARRLLWAKNLNCGQVCIAPDYVLVEKSVAEDFYAQLERTYADFFPEGVDKEEYGRIVNDRNMERLLLMLEEEEAIRGKILVGGEWNREERYISPTILVGTSPKAKVMEEEIFGPILPIFEVENQEEAQAFINARPKPLAAYMFSTSSKAIEQFLSSTSSGNAVINDVVMHFAEGALPFGGVGNSGIGCGHGYHGFQTFSHMKGVLHKSSRSMFDPPIRYPPYSEKKKWLMKKFI